MNIIAHRGDEDTFPENTIKSITSAIEKGSDYVEVNVRVTTDGKGSHA